MNKWVPGKRGKKLEKDVTKQPAGKSLLLRQQNSNTFSERVSMHLEGSQE